MIVDLLRNDLSRVCVPDSVRVTQLCRLEIYEYVQHLVSAVCGTLADGAHAARSAAGRAFPAARSPARPRSGPWRSSPSWSRPPAGRTAARLGYLGFDGAMDTSILIRTITAGRGWWQAPVGGGIVAQSVPEREYEETWHKAEGLIRGLALEWEFGGTRLHDSPGRSRVSFGRLILR